MITHFTWQELTKTNTGLDNTPTDINRIANLIDLAKALDLLRAYYGKPIIVNSAYRSTEVNAKVGGVATSHHTMGLAADITSKDFDSLKKAVLDYMLYKADQVIVYEKQKFIHISIAPQMRHQLLYK